MKYNLKALIVAFTMLVLMSLAYCFAMYKTKPEVSIRGTNVVYNERTEQYETVD